MEPDTASCQELTLHSAPMMGVSDVVWREMVHFLAPRCYLHTEMIHTRAFLRAGAELPISVRPGRGRTILQVAGTCPKELRAAAFRARDFGFFGIDLNVGCPSSKVQKGGFGVVLMRDAQRLAELLESMHDILPTSFKCRLGIMGEDISLGAILREVEQLRLHFVTVHARRALLHTSPKVNRKAPPLCDEEVYAEVRTHPSIGLVLNGGITLSNWRKRTDDRGLWGYMVGRAFARYPMEIPLYGRDVESKTRVEVLEHLFEHFAEDPRTFARSCRHGAALWHGIPGRRRWIAAIPEGPRRLLSLARELEAAYWARREKKTVT